jgi:hypothetical protein
MKEGFQHGELAQSKVSIFKPNAGIGHGGIRSTGQFYICIQGAFPVSCAFRVPAHSQIKLTAKDAKNAKKIIKNSSSHCAVHVPGRNQSIEYQNFPGAAEDRT